MFRIVLTVVSFLLLTGSLYAQQRTYSLVVTPDEANYLARLLEERPLKESGNLYGKMQQQITQQDQVAAESFRKQTREQLEKEAADKKAAEGHNP